MVRPVGLHRPAADPSVFTATFTPTADTESQTNAVNVGADYSDTAGNTGTAASSENYVIDTVAPTVTIGLDDVSLIAGETATVTFTFSEPPVDFTADDVAVENAGTVRHHGNGRRQTCSPPL